MKKDRVIGRDEIEEGEMARFRVVVVTRERSYPRKRAVVLIFGGCGWCWLPGSGEPPENERDGSFSGVVGGGRLKRIIRIE